MNPRIVRARQRQQLISTLAVILGIIGVYILAPLISTENWLSVVLEGALYFGSVALLIWIGQRLFSAWTNR